MATEPIATIQSGSQAAVVSKRTPLLNQTMVVFMVAMVLANISSHMYEPLLPLYSEELECQRGAGGFVLHPVADHPVSPADPGRLDLGYARAPAQHCLWQYRGRLIVCGYDPFAYLAVGAAGRRPGLHDPLAGGSELRGVHRRAIQRGEPRPVFGISETIFMVVAVIGPPLGGWLADTYGFQVMLLCAAGLYTLATVIRVLMARVAARKQEANPEKLSLDGLKMKLGTMLGLVLAGGLVTWILVTDGVQDVAYSLSFNLLPVYLNDFGGLSVQQIGWLESIFGVFMMLITVPAGMLADRKGERLGIALGFFLQFLALMVFIRVSDFLGICVRLGVAGVGDGHDVAGFPICDQQSRARARARHSVWPVQHQPGGCLAACAADRRPALATCGSEIPLHAHRLAGLDRHHTGMV